MTRTFYSKVDWWYYLLILASVSIMILCFWYKNNIGGVIWMMVNFFVIQSLTQTKYVASLNSLVVNIPRPFKSYNIDINSIISIKKAKSLTPGIALSRDRIEICYRTAASVNYVAISPKDKQSFIDYLRKINGNIVVEI